MNRMKKKTRRQGGFLEKCTQEMKHQLFSKSFNVMLDKTCSLLHYPVTKIHIQWGSWEDRKPAVIEIAGFAFGRYLPVKSSICTVTLSHLDNRPKTHSCIAYCLTSTICMHLHPEWTKKTRWPSQRVNPSFGRVEETGRTISNFPRYTKFQVSIPVILLMNNGISKKRLCMDFVRPSLVSLCLRNFIHEHRIETMHSGTAMTEHDFFVYTYTRSRNRYHRGLCVSCFRLQDSQRNFEITKLTPWWKDKRGWPLSNWWCFCLLRVLPGQCYWKSSLSIAAGATGRHPIVWSRQTPWQWTTLSGLMGN